MAIIKSIIARDSSGIVNLGRAGELVNISLTLDEAISVTNGTINKRTVRPTLMIGGQTVADSLISFVSYNPSAKTINYQLTLPSGINGNQITLTGLNVANITLTGKSGNLESFTGGTDLTAAYTLDNVAPAFTSPSVLTAIPENSNARQTAIYTAIATDTGSGAITYSLGGSHGHLFTISKTGVVNLRANPDFETQSLYSFSVIASDAAGNTSTRNLALTITNVDEAVTLAKGVTGVGTLTAIRRSNGTLTSISNTLASDFVVDSSNANTFIQTGLPTGLTLSTTGVLTGTAAAGSYRFTVRSNDNNTNGTDASRQYQLVVLNAPAVTSISVSDAIGVANTGLSNSLVTIKVTLSEALTSNNFTNLGATFSAGRANLSNVQFQNAVTDSGRGVLTFTGTLPTGDSSSIALTSLSLGSNRLIGSISGGTLSNVVTKLNVSGNYLLDNSAPRFTSPASININENLSDGTVIYNAQASDANPVTYSITRSGDGNLPGSAGRNLFNINPSTGAVTVNGNINFEDPNNSDKRFILTLTATDSNGNSTSRPITINVRDVNEATQLKAGVVGTGAYNVYQTVDAKYSIPSLANDFSDPENRAINYRISDGWLAPGLTLNARTGVISGKVTATANSYQFTVTADDGIENGTDASRSYTLSYINASYLTVNDPYLGTGDSTVTFSLYGTFAKGGTLQLYKQGGTAIAIGSEIALTKNSETFSLTFSKSDANLALAENTAATYFFRYINQGVTVNSSQVTVVRDIITPSVTSVSLTASGATNNLLSLGDVVTASVTFQENVIVTGNPIVLFAMGSGTSLQNRTATYVAGASSNVLNFVYTITGADNDSDGISMAANSLTLSGGATIRDPSGYNAMITHTAISANSSLMVDTTPPNALQVTFNDTGSSGSDGITTDGNITIANLESGATWQYQINNGAWQNGSGNRLSANLGNNTYQIRQIDRAGNISDTTTVRLDLRALAQGFVINGQGLSDESGFSVSIAGDVNGDGLSDVIIGAYNADPTGNADAGRAYVVFGKASAAPVNLADIVNGAGGFVINGAGLSEQVATSVSNAGDLNADGFADLIIGAPYSDTAAGLNAGRAYVVWGKSTTGAVNLADVLNGTNGFVINGISGADYAGWSVSVAGDIDGDGLPDLIIGASEADAGVRTNSGRAFVVYGKTSNTAVNLTAVAAGTGGFVINGNSADDLSGFSVSSAGDVDGDGIVDLIIGARDGGVSTNFGTNRNGISYVVFGKTNNSSINLSQIAAGTGGFQIQGEVQGDQAGFSVSAAGDVNGDGLGDLLVGAPVAGRAYVLFGKTTNATKTGNSNINLATTFPGNDANGAGFLITRQINGDQAGFSVSNAGDVNGDGLADIIVGSPFADVAGMVDAGKAYVVFGKTSSADVPLGAVANGTGGFVINGQGLSDSAGARVSGAGDVNGDGLADLIVGAPYADVGSVSNAGRSYIIFGKTDTKPVNLADIVNSSGTPVSYNFAGTSAADLYYGSSASEIIIGGAGNDTLFGNGGADVILGGAGNDEIVLDQSNINALLAGVAVTGGDALAGTVNYQLPRVDGGSGFDTIRLKGRISSSGFLTNNLKIVPAGNPDGGGRVSNIERLDLLSDPALQAVYITGKWVADNAGINLFNTSNGWVGVNLRADTKFGAKVPMHQMIVDMGTNDNLLSDFTPELNNAAVNPTNAIVQKDGLSYQIYNNTTTNSQILIRVQSQGPLVSITPIAGQDQYLNPGESSINFDVALSTTTRPAVGDVLQFRLNGAAIGTPVTVNATTQTSASFMFTKASINNGIDSEYPLILRVTSSTGAIKGELATTVIIDSSVRTPQLIIDDNGVSNTDGATSIGKITIGNLEDGATWQYQIGSNTTTWTNGTGNSLTPLEGQQTYRVRQIDAAGNTSAVASSVINFAPILYGFVVNGEGGNLSKFNRLFGICCRGY